MTPFLDGVDIKDDGSLRGSARPPHHVYSPSGGFAIFAINSSNWCHTLEPIAPVSQATWDKLPAVAESAPTQKAIEKLLTSLRLQDVARISDGQLRAVQALIRDVDNQAADEGQTEPVRIAVLHHQLLPVSTFEEFKPFETITNLGLLRNFLREMSVSAVLHGHKHHGFIYKDHVYSPEAGLGKAAHEVLVLAGSTVGGTDYQKASICRLLRVDPTKGAGSNRGDIGARPYLAEEDCRNAGVNGLLTGSVPPTAGRWAPLWSTQIPRVRLMPGWCRCARRSSGTWFVRYVTRSLLRGCLLVIQEINEEGGEGDPASWFKDIVSEWQKPDSKLGKTGSASDTVTGSTPMTTSSAEAAYNQVRAAARTLAIRKQVQPRRRRSD